MGKQPMMDGAHHSECPQALATGILVSCTLQPTGTPWRTEGAASLTVRGGEGFMTSDMCSVSKEYSGQRTMHV